MKKTVALFTAMLVMAAVFFCTPVFAAVPIPQRRVTQHYQTGNLYVTTTATLLYSQTYEAAGMANGYMGGAVTETVITLRLYNGSATQDTALETCVISLNYDSNNVAPFICGWENFSTDLFIADGASTQLLTVVPSADYAHYTGIVIPPHSSLYLVASIYTQAKNNTSSTTPDSVYLSSVTTSVTGVNSGTFTYPGDPTPNDLGEIVESINNIENDVSLLQDIKDALIWQGTIYSPNYNPTQTITKVQSDTGLPYFYNVISVSTGQSHIVVDTVDAVDNDSAYHQYTRAVPITLSIQMENYYEYAVSNTAGVDPNAFILESLLPNNQDISYEMAASTSDVFQNPRFFPDQNGYMSLMFDYKMGIIPDGGGTFRGLVPVGLNYSTFTIIAYIRNSQTLQLNTSFPFPAFTAVQTNMKLYADERQHLSNIDKNLQQFLDNYNSVNGIGDLSDNANDLTEGLNNAHETEQGYFESNSQALAASGISNPNFEAADRTGINSAITGNKNQFGLLWNAIGAWRNIYVYAALLGLVTYLLRHKPWISGGRRHRYEENGQ